MPHQDCQGQTKNHLKHQLPSGAFVNTGSKAITYFAISKLFQSNSTLTSTILPNSPKNILSRKYKILKRNSKSIYRFSYISKNISRVIIKTSWVKKNEVSEKNINSVIIFKKTKRMYILYSCMIIGQNTRNLSLVTLWWWGWEDPWGKRKPLSFSSHIAVWF